MYYDELEAALLYCATSQPCRQKAKKRSKLRTTDTDSHRLGRKLPEKIRCYVSNCILLERRWRYSFRCIFASSILLKLSSLFTVCIDLNLLWTNYKNHKYNGSSSPRNHLCRAIFRFRAWEGEFQSTSISTRLFLWIRAEADIWILFGPLNLEHHLLHYQCPWHPRWIQIGRQTHWDLFQG